MESLLHLLAALIVSMVFVPVAVWAYDHDRVAMFAATIFIGCSALWVVMLFGVVWVITML